MAKMPTVVMFKDETAPAIQATGECLDKVLEALKKKGGSKRVERYLAWNMFLLSKILIKGIIFK